MINPQELRLSNWVKSPKSIGYIPAGMMQIESISMQGVNVWHDMGASGCGRFEDLEPILLTPEILEAAGFEKDVEHDCYVIWQNDSHVALEYFDGQIHLVGHNSAEPMDNCQYLHQLQNLYFCLTGSELTINLTEKVNV